eukprot:11336821-Alexandrium_andersonii.AAC.1
MSASLVGSEMCIRDSLSPPRATHAELAMADVPTRRVPRAACAARSARPVSYTHLTLPTICSV